MLRFLLILCAPMTMIRFNSFESGLGCFDDFDADEIFERS